jgi:hypothetical protein
MLPKAARDIPKSSEIVDTPVHRDPTHGVVGARVDALSWVR